MVDMNSTYTVQTGHYMNDFKPYQVDVDELPKTSRGRDSKVYTPNVISLLGKNLDRWFVIQEAHFEKDDRKAIASKRSTFYQSSKLHVLKYPNLEYMVRGESDSEGTHTLRLMARFVSEDK